MYVRCFDALLHHSKALDDHILPFQWEAKSKEMIIYVMIEYWSLVQNVLNVGKVTDNMGVCLKHLKLGIEYLVDPGDPVWFH